MIYKIPGIIFISVGTGFILFFNLVVPSTPLAGAGLSMIILGSSSMSLSFSGAQSPYLKYILTMAGLFIIINLIFGIFGQKDFALYVAANSLIFILVTLFFNLSSRVMAALRPIGLILFVGFILAIAFKVKQML